MQVCGQPDELAAAQEIVQLYRLRWRIEQVFRAMRPRPGRLLFRLDRWSLLGACPSNRKTGSRWDWNSHPWSFPQW
jgi:hypothetical protein